MSIINYIIQTGKEDPKLQQQDELKLLADAKNVVNTQAFHMKRALVNINI